MGERREITNMGMQMRHTSFYANGVNPSSTVEGKNEKNQRIKEAKTP